MNTQALTPILDKIKAYDHIILFRHRRPDGDCLGASKGLQHILRLSFPGKVIDLPESDTSDYLAFLGPDDPALYQMKSMKMPWSLSVIRPILPASMTSAIRMVIS